MREDLKILGVPANSHDAELEGVCGKCCAECRLFYRKLEEEPELAAKVSEQLGIEGIEQHELRCEGCTSLKRFVHISECPICFCCKDYGVSFCKECSSSALCEMKKEISNVMTF